MSKHKGFFKESEIEKISSKLKFISKIEPGQKISVKSNYIQNNTYYTSVVRYLTGEDREKVYSYVCDVIQDSFSVLDSLSDSSNDYDIKICRNMIADLLDLKPGLDNLKKTYNKDKNYVSKMETLTQNLDVKIEELCNKKNIDLEQIMKEKKEQKEKEEMVAKKEKELAAKKEDEKKKASASASASASAPEAEKPQKNKTDSKKDKSKETEGVTESSEEADAEDGKKKKKSYADAVKAKNKARRNRNGGPSKKNTYQYESYYLSNPDDLYNYPADLDAGIIKKHG